MNENLPKKPRHEREITYRIGRKTGKIDTMNKVEGAANHKRLSHDKENKPSTALESGGRGEGAAAFLRRTIWMEAKQPPAIILQIGLIVYPLICFLLVFYLLTILSNLDW
ncbi:MAG: hypothetical protein H7X86_01085 [Gorillibacterium sp.]|nr:hypothetical protein [Gorillibacterium sp.]